MEFRAAVITASDRSYRGERKDESGPLVAEMLSAAGYRIVSCDILSDERQMLAERMKVICDKNEADLIVTTGGTGFSPRDYTPEATIDIAERMVPGIPEAMRAYSLQKTNRAILSRSVAVIRSKTLIINLPGSPNAAKENLECVLDALEHGLEMLTGVPE
ncbi:molybdenum cofactor biosynthesis protein [Spirochaetia bacterium]|nr:molybdenum cofactor biosynthesis protein [Spirochaetia bacterium]